MYNRQIWEASASDSLIHRIDVRTKLVLLAAVGAGFSVGTVLLRWEI